MWLLWVGVGETGVTNVDNLTPDNRITNNIINIIMTILDNVITILTIVLWLKLFDMDFQIHSYFHWRDEKQDKLTSQETVPLPRGIKIYLKFKTN